ncbi:MAG: hypothetical protein OXN17_14565 [Candidatus Poribacteria bacterium]|nr:hypothetical protein [Candidatus Poribacteria bacterium]MDE0503037.1 hypothetical protein [Candidatus Poribacteria bacterium]
MVIGKSLQVILKLITCTVGGVAAWLALSTFAPKLYESAIERYVPASVWYCAAFGLVAGIGWAIGFKSSRGIPITSGLIGWSVGIGFLLLRSARVSWIECVVLLFSIAAAFWFLKQVWVFRKKEDVE